MILTAKMIDADEALAFGLIKVYNFLPQDVVAASSVPEFQKRLQHLVKTHAEGGDANWKNTLSPRVPWWNHPPRHRKKQQ